MSKFPAAASSAPRGRLWLLGTLFVVVFPAVALGTAGYHQVDLALILAAASVWVYSGLRAVWEVWARSGTFVGLCFWTFVYVALGIVPAVQLGPGELPWPGNYRWSYILGAYGLIWLGICSFELGRVMVPKRFLEGTVSNLTRLLGTLRVRRLVVVGVLATVLSLALITVAGIPWSVFFEPRAIFLEVVSGRLGLAGYSAFASLIRVPLAVVLVGLIVAWRAGVKVRSSVLIAFAFIVAVTSNPLTTPRFWVGTVALAVLVSIAPFRGLRRRFLWAILLPSLYLFLFPLADAFRFNVGVEHLLEDLRQTESVLEGARAAFSSGEYDSFQQLLNAIEVSERRGHTTGAQTLGVVLFPVPRSIWPSKPSHTGEVLATELSYPYTNLGAPLWGEGYLEFGVFGVMLFLGVYGAFTRIAGEMEVEGGRTADPLGAEVLVAILAPYQFLLLRGSLAIGVAFFAPVVVTILIHGFLMRVRWSR